MKLSFSLLVVVLCSFLLAGCESTGGSSESRSAASASAIPWNKPASWEGAGALGGLGFQGSH